MNLSERFHERFLGLDRAHGRFKESDVVSKKGKRQGAFQTLREPASPEIWDQHLNGEISIGIVPIRDDATVKFGAIDIDSYKLNLDDLSKRVVDLELPLILCRSKSGGAHLFIFFKEFISAEIVVSKLMEWAVLLGYSGVEVFPKQTRLASENDFGNWINAPYHDYNKTQRYAIYNGKKLTAKEFLDLADLIEIDEETLSEINPPAPELDDLWEEGPPCLQSLSLRGFGEGTRNNSLFNIGVYLRKRYGEFWEEHLDKYNQKFMDPPLGHKEVSTIVRSLKRKTYEFKCNDQPICDACNKQICRTRKFGVSTGDGDPGVVFGRLVKLRTDPPIWIWDVDGARIELTTNELKDQMRFHTRCIEILNKWPNIIKPLQWANLIRDKLQTIEVIDVPSDATPEGQMMYHLEQYCTGRQKARKRDELLLNKPWTEDGRTYFSAPHFKKYLEQQRMRVNERQLWAWLRNQGAKPKFFNIKGKGINTWGIPKFTEQEEGFDIPTLEDEEM